MKKTLVAFYSLDGNTRYIAGVMAKQLQADLLEIKPKRAYPSKGFLKYFRGGKSVLRRECPELLPLKFDPAEYEAVILWTPVWAGSFAAPIRSFLTRNKIEGKKVALFACHAAQGADAAKKCLDQLKMGLTGNTFVGETDFQNPLHQKEENAKRAVQWAENLKF